MHMIHELKCWPTYFRALWDGSKRFELRKADRPFAAGDSLRLREYIIPSGYTGHELTMPVTYVLRGGVFGLPDDMCILSLGEPVREQLAAVAPCPR